MKSKSLHKNRLQNGAKNSCLNDDFLEQKIESLHQNLDEDLEMISDLKFSESEIESLDLNVDIDLNVDFELDLNIELDLGFSDILDFKLIEMSDLDWKDLLDKLNFDIELPDFDVLIEE